MDGGVIVGDFVEDLARLLRSPIGRLAILTVLAMLLLVIYVNNPFLIVMGGLLLFGVFEFFYRKRHLLEKKIVVPLPNFLEPDFGSVCSCCRRNVGRGNLKKFENKWICGECYGNDQKVRGDG